MLVNAHILGSTQEAVKKESGCVRGVWLWVFVWPRATSPAGGSKSVLWLGKKQVAESGAFPVIYRRFQQSRASRPRPHIFSPPGRTISPCRFHLKSKARNTSTWQLFAKMAPLSTLQSGSAKRMTSFT